ncbi:MAG: hypothetical protein ACSHX9_00235 [Luteolibacter sp.]
MGQTRGESLGEASLSCASFIEDDRPRPELIYMEINGLAVVLYLQHRLNELRIGAQILII